MDNQGYMTQPKGKNKVLVIHSKEIDIYELSGKVLNIIVFLKLYMLYQAQDYELSSSLDLPYEKC